MEAAAMNGFLWFIIILSILDLAGRAWRLYSGNTTVQACETIMNMFLNIGLALWAAYLLGRQS